MTETMRSRTSFTDLSHLVLFLAIFMSDFINESPFFCKITNLQNDKYAICHQDSLKSWFSDNVPDLFLGGLNLSWDTTYSFFSLFSLVFPIGFMDSTVECVMTSSFYILTYPQVYYIFSLFLFVIC